MATTPPTAARGFVVEDWYGGVLDDWAGEWVPDLAFPSSVQTYAKMRTDSTLASTLSGWTLQLRRAQWQLDGAGCRPEVVKLAAEDVGLPVKGTDTAGAARVRGVSWSEHLRAALLQLPFGFAAFELLAEMRDGKARLAALADRMPSTVCEFHVHPGSGALEGISQTPLAGKTQRKPQIPADRLALYSHDREGAGYQGRSLLRPSYPAWLFKRELMRVLSTSSRRFGMGVPTVEWAPGTNPTPTQHADAQRVASAARVGDQAGAAMPPGAMLRLVGLSGGTPDTLAYIKWLDGQMTRAALMTHLDLGGESSNGSRALGEAFIDSWTLALEALAEQICDTATRQIVARLVEWNYGQDEPVPRVTVAGIGSRREVTAASLQQLLSAGALSADPGLESWVRREYRLPEREEPPARQPLRRGGPKPSDQPSADDAAPDQPDQADGEQPAATPPPSRKPRRKVAAAPGQLDLFAAAPEPGEPDYTAIDQQWQQAVDDLTAQWEQAAEPAVTEIVAAVAAAGGLAALTALVASGGIVLSGAALAAMSGPIGAALLAIAAASAEDVIGEALAAGVKAKRGRPDRQALQQRAEAVAAVIAQGYVQGASRVVLAEAGGNATAVQVADAVERHLDDMTATAAGAGRRGWVAGQLAEALTAAQAEGRNATYEANATRVVGFRASEVNDKNRCGPCSEIDGKTYPDREATLVDYPVAGFRSCDGRARCRGILRAIWG